MEKPRCRLCGTRHWSREACPAGAIVRGGGFGDEDIGEVRRGLPPRSVVAGVVGEVEKRGRGRPRKERVLTSAERKARWRAKKRAKEEGGDGA